MKRQVLHACYGARRHIMESKFYDRFSADNLCNSSVCRDFSLYQWETKRATKKILPDNGNAEENFSSLLVSLTLSSLPLVHFLSRLNRPFNIASLCALREGSFFFPSALFLWVCFVLRIPLLFTQVISNIMNLFFHIYIHISREIYKKIFSAL